MDVTIYLDVYHTGHLKKGTGSYTIILEYIKTDGVPVTRDYVRRIKGTTKNRTELLACISAFHELIKPCNVKVVTNAEYITQAINTGDWYRWLNTGKNAKGKPVKNLDLWQQFFDLVDKHHTEFAYAEKNSYTDYMFNQMKKVSIIYEEDTGNGEK